MTLRNLKNDFDKTKFIEQYSPWHTRRAHNVYVDFLASKDDFTWLDIDDDLKAFFSSPMPEFTTPMRKFVSNIHYGIPDHTQGDFETAKLFICLSNPNIELPDKCKFDSLKDYYAHMQGRNSPDPSLRLDNFKEPSDVQRHIVSFDQESSILFKELSILINQERVTQDDIKTRYYINNYFRHMIQAAYQLHMNISRKTTLEEIFNTNRPFLSLIRDAAKQIVNLEAFPFRSQKPGDFGKYIVQSDSCVSLWSARVILWRIAQVESGQQKDTEKPVFIFRRFNDFWKPLLKAVLKMDYAYDDAAVDNVLGVLHERYFLTNYKQAHHNVSRWVTQNTLYRQNSKITADTFEQLNQQVFLRECN